MLDRIPLSSSAEINDGMSVDTSDVAGVLDHHALAIRTNAPAMT